MIVVCESCETIVTEGNYECDGSRYYCKSCFQEHLARCCLCGEVTEKDEAMRHNNNDYCVDCFDCVDCFEKEVKR